MATDTQVLVVGAGPAGLFMAAELNRHGVSCRIVDKNDGPTYDSRAASIQARTMEILESVGLADEFVQAGNVCHAAATYNSDHKLIKYLTFDELDSAFPFVLEPDRADSGSLSGASRHGGGTACRARCVRAGRRRSARNASACRRRTGNGSRPLSHRLRRRPQSGSPRTRRLVFW